MTINIGGKMKNKKKLGIDLQLFAEDPSTNEDNNQDQNKNQDQDQEKQDREKQDQEIPKVDKKYTDQDVDNIVKKKKTEWEKKLEEAKKIEKMNVEQRLKHENDKLQEELEELRKEKYFNEMSNTARTMLKESGITISDDMVKHLVTNETESTKKNIENFTSIFKDSVEKAVQERLKGKTPTAMGNSSSKLTRESILAVKDRIERQRLIGENPELFR